MTKPPDMLTREQDEKLVCEYLAKLHKQWQIEFGRIEAIGAPPSKTIGEIEASIEALSETASEDGR